VENDPGLVEELEEELAEKYRASTGAADYEVWYFKLESRSS
jgi:hypothetical protein